jgi:hypothetical protein
MSRLVGLTMSHIAEEVFDAADPIVAARQVDNGDRIEYSLLADRIEFLRSWARVASWNRRGSVT